MSLSPWFFVLSPQVGAAHWPAVQTPLTQSLAELHFWAVPHFFAGAHEPPQSTSVSVPFLTVSEHVGIWQTLGVPLQTPLVQSLAPTHFLPSAQAAHAPPPQSTSVSVPSRTRLLHPVDWHTVAVQTLLAQSPMTAQCCPSAHFLAGAQDPPQSLSVSVPFLTVSEHVGAWHVTLQTPLWQSLGAPQVLPFAHVFPGAQMPPQSMSDSV
jgi:hypothetical protein